MGGDTVLKFRDVCFDTHKEKQVGLSASVVEEAIQKRDEDFEKILDHCILQHLKEKHEGRCIHEGYVLPNSIRIVKRSDVSFPVESLRIHYTSQVCWSMRVCCPHVESLLECNVVSKNKIGILGSLAEDGVPLIFLIPNDLAKTPEELSAMEKAVAGDTLHVRVLGKRFEQGDKKIMIIAKCEV